MFLHQFFFLCLLHVLCNYILQFSDINSLSMVIEIMNHFAIWNSTQHNYFPFIISLQVYLEGH